MKFKCFSIGAHNSGGMLSDNAHSGVYETDMGRSLDLNGGNPACYQGGIVVLAAIEGNGSRPSHKGIGINDGKVMYTLNGTEVHGVVATQRNVNDISEENGNAVSGGASRKL